MAKALPAPEAVGVVTPDLAFKLLCVLGPETSISQLHKVLVAKYGVAYAPGPRTLDQWARKHEWRERRAQFDSVVNERVDEMLVDAQVKHRSDQISSLNAIAEKTFEYVNAALTGGVTSDGTPVAQVPIKNNLAELERLLGVGLKASTQHSLLTGKPTSISESRQLMADIDDEALLKRLERKLKVIPGEAVEIKGEKGGGGRREGED
jgi:hypothetical protein